MKYCLLVVVLFLSSYAKNFDTTYSITKKNEFGDVVSSYKIPHIKIYPISEDSIFSINVYEGDFHFAGLLKWDSLLIRDEESNQSVVLRSRDLTTVTLSKVGVSIIIVGEILADEDEKRYNILLKSSQRYKKVISLLEQSHDKITVLHYWTSNRGRTSRSELVSYSTKNFTRLFNHHLSISRNYPIYRKSTIVKPKKKIGVASYNSYGGYTTGLDAILTGSAGLKKSIKSTRKTLGKVGFGSSSKSKTKVAQ